MPSPRAIGYWCPGVAHILLIIINQCSIHTHIIHIIHTKQTIVTTALTLGYVMYDRYTILVFVWNHYW
jgi:hypothetical protein